MTAWPTTGDLLAVLPAGFRGAAQGAEVELGMFDQPVIVSGQRAVVLPVTLDGERRAIRFSLADPSSSRPRYEAVNEALRQYPHLPLVRTTWEPQGVEIRDGVYPVMVMDWVDARPLADVVDDMVAVGDLDGVASLTTRLSGAFHELEAAGIVHGDLQHGNIMVTDSRITLVDYDSVFVAGMPENRGPDEAGHPNYRHPGAAHLPGGRPNGDAFAATLIIASLTWISVRPELWRFHHGENLILDAADLENPAESDAWREIDVIGLVTSTAYATRIRGMLSLDPESLPSFSRAIALDEPLIDADATRPPDRMSVQHPPPGDATVVASSVTADRPTVGSGGSDRPTIGSAGVPLPPGAPLVSQVPDGTPAAVAPSSVDNLQLPSAPPPGTTEMRALPPEIAPDVSGARPSRKAVVIPLVLAMVLLAVLAAGGTWWLLSSDGGSDDETVASVEVVDEPGDAGSTELREDDTTTTAEDNTTTTEPDRTTAGTTKRPPTTAVTSAGTCDVVTSTMALDWMQTPPPCLDYTASASLPTTPIPSGWFVALASAVMTDPGAAATSESQLDQYQANFPGAVRVDSRLYRGMRDPVWAIVLPVDSESDALAYCAYPELSGVDGCTARHTELTLDELQAGQRP